MKRAIFFIFFVFCTKAGALDIQDSIEKCAKSTKAPGIIVGYIDEGKTSVFSHGGRLAEALRLSVTENTVFEIGSVTKLFTSLLLMDMVSKGEISLDDSISKYFPENPSLENITVRHLATHHSGLPCLPSNINPKNLLNPYQDYTYQNLEEFLRQFQPEVEPGTHFEYSNLGVGLLGIILSKQANMPYETLIQERICKPLGLKSTAVTITWEMHRVLAGGYHLGEKVPLWDIPTFPGAGAIRSNLKDMMQLLKASMGLINTPLDSSFKACQEQQYPVEDLAGGVGLGWLLSNDVIWHNGCTGGHRCFIGFCPRTQRGTVILTNSPEEGPDIIGFYFLTTDR